MFSIVVRHPHSGRSVLQVIYMCNKHSDIKNDFSYYMAPYVCNFQLMNKVRGPEKKASQFIVQSVSLQSFLFSFEAFTIWLNDETPLMQSCLSETFRKLSMALTSSLWFNYFLLYQIFVSEQDSIQNWTIHCLSLTHACRINDKCCIHIYW